MKDAIGRIARALLVDYSSVYLVDLKTDEYECFNTDPGFQRLALQTFGTDFFADCVRDVALVVYEEDRELIGKVMEKSYIREIIRNESSFSVTYRLVIDGAPVWHSMRIIHDPSDQDDCVILGIRNIDDEVRAEKSTRRYNSIARTLAQQYSTIYYVNIENNHYVEYSSSDAYKDLAVPPEGDDFFTESRKNILRVIHPEDSDKVYAFFEKNVLLGEVSGGRPFFLTYRLMINGQPEHVRLMAVLDPDGKHMIVGVTSIEEETRREQELKAVSEKNMVFSQVAESLAMQYGMIYYIDTETDHYIEFTSQQEYRELNVSPVGDDFFRTSQRNVSLIIHPEDRLRVFEALDKQNILNELKTKSRFTLTYRLLLKEGAGYTRMSVVWANDHKHLVMGVMNIDSEMEMEHALRKAREENEVFGHIAESLANQYDTIYYVDILKDSYVEFSSTDVYKTLEIQPSGDDFFAVSKVNARRVVYEEDQESFLRFLDKENLFRELAGRQMATHTYRLNMPDGPKYTRLSVIWATDSRHLIIGVANVDREIRKEQEVREIIHQANEKAYRDELTGIKNKNAYQDYEQQLQKNIRDGIAGDFGVVVCDVNGLKAVNDTLGHKAGDAYIQSACRMICEVWEHSPVFRVGGDEFVVILQGQDYQNRDALLQKLLQQSRKNQETGDAIVAAGLSVYRPGEDAGMAAVFERADSRMYETKLQLKGARV